LVLSDGKTFKGQAPDWQERQYVGEVVFNTGMTGYVESLTDPSYANQILVFTYPMIGNYGVQPGDAESDRIQVAGVVMSELALEGSHGKSNLSFPEWLRSQGVPLLTGVDTRALTKHLRTKGTMLGYIGDGPIKARDLHLELKQVTIPKPVTYNRRAGKKIILVDCGAKENILRELLKLPVEVKRVPADYDYTEEHYDGVVLSNGPGDPTDYQPTIAVARKALKGSKPVFGICLGTQIMALAAGAKTYKLKFGHRGHNQPCMDTGDERCYVTSQNHGYAIDEKSLPSGWQVLFRNLNDDSVEGIKHHSKPFFSVQFHPEARPGPTDTNWLFERFAKEL
ncbi:MAG TPA: glutamine-hydrolyzing carbamoyl-phosphate synthase small subunit, partial [Verrucomicrobiae bacterium]|nr:glutamine-hydrolyzing carbamoyl-phosphate synthase small subunit [Verrucomicrobiae bacterium]